ncbi:MAG: hypothetical protein RLO00_09460 [Fulvivirga sp.]
MSQSCKQELLKAYKIYAVDNYDQGFLLDYKIEIDYRESIPTASDVVKTYGNKHKSVLRSNDYVVFQDDSLVVSVIEKSKAIYISKRNAQPMENTLATAMNLQDSLIKSAQSVTCENVIKGGKQSKLFKVIPSEEVTNQTKVSEFILCFDPETNGFLSSEIFYSEGVMNNIRVTINEYQLSYKGEVFSGNALGQVMNAKEIKSQYRQYKLVDTRKYNNQ